MSFICYCVNIMARTHSIALYLLRVRKPASSKEDSFKEINLHDKVGNNKSSFYDFLNQFTQKYFTSTYITDSSELLLRINKLNTKSLSPFYINGLVEKGDSGITSTLYNTRTHIEKGRTTEEAELLPYYFCISETTNPNIAVLCMARSGNIGVKTLFQEALKKEFKIMFSDKNVLSVEDYLPSFCKDQFLKNNKVRKISYTYLSKVEDVASLLEVNGVRNVDIDDAIITVTVKPRRGLMLWF